MLIHVYMNTRIICVWQKQLAASAEGLEAQFAEAMEMAMQKDVEELRRVKEEARLAEEARQAEEARRAEAVTESAIALAVSLLCSVKKWYLYSVRFLVSKKYLLYILHSAWCEGKQKKHNNKKHST